VSRSIAVTLSRWSGYSWLVAVLAMLVVTISNGMTNAGLTVFDESLLNEFQCGVASLKTRDSITFLGGSLFVLGAGWLVDRHGFKPFLMLGLGLLSVTYYLYSHAQSLVQLYLLHLLFALVIAMAGNMTAIVTAATWMPKRRGLAIGMTVAGTSIGGTLIPPIATALNTRFGWRTSMRLESLWPLILLIVIAVLLRNRPKAASDSSQAAVESRQGMPFKEVVRRSQFYRVVGSGALTFFSILALFSHLFLYMRSLEFDPVKASLALSTLSIAGLCGKLLSGWVSDRLDPYGLLTIQMGMMFVGLLGITFLPDAVWLFLVVAGFGWGSLHTLYNFILIALFGLRDAGKINGSLSLAGALGGGLGIFVTGVLHDALGGYPSAFAVVCIVMFVGFLMTIGLRPPAEPQST
jgi:predicted MFS family arabinose efflux permease